MVVGFEKVRRNYREILLIYTFIISLLSLVLRLGGLFIPKFKKWNKDRSEHLEIVRKLPLLYANGKPVIWFHCASLGEFEQTRSIIEKLSDQKNHFLLLTFFSPSGYEVRKNYKKVDLVLYLPIDTRKNMSLMVDKIKPSLFVGVKYDFWWHLFECLNKRQIPKFFIAMKMDENHYIFNRFAKKYLQILGENASFFCQDRATSTLLSNKIWNAKDIKTVGDPRVDSVLERMVNPQTLEPLVKENFPPKKVIIYGSIYDECMDVITPFIQKYEDDYLHILVPHDVSKGNISDIAKKLNKSFVFLNEMKQDHSSSIIVVNEIGKLFDLYALADLVYIGGGFTKNLHNTLEPARFGLPIIIGPKHRGFEEVDAFLELGIAIEVKNADEFTQAIQSQSLEKRADIKIKTGEYFTENDQASHKIVQEVLTTVVLKKHL